MNLLTIRISELEDFVSSPLYEKLNPKPITWQRAVSQSRNPRANANDVALVIAYSDDFKLLAYIGALPDNINLDGTSHHMAWNSNWWSHPEDGKQAAMRVFAELYKSWDYNICYSDLDEKGKKFIATTGKYQLRKYEGYKFIMRSFISEFVARKHKLLNNPVTWLLLGFVDFWLNSVSSLFQYSGLPTDEEMRLPDTCDVLPADALKFISEYPLENCSGRNSEEINWITQNPWILTGRKNKLVYENQYYFSYSAKKFKNYFLVFRSKKEINAVIWVQNRDNNVRLPYVFIKPGKENFVNFGLLKHLVLRRTKTLTLFHPALIKILSGKTNFLSRKLMYRYAALPNSLGNFPENLYIQDGDGDAVFC